MEEDGEDRINESKWNNCGPCYNVTRERRRKLKIRGNMNIGHMKETLN